MADALSFEQAYFTEPFSTKMWFSFIRLNRMLHVEFIIEQIKLKRAKYLFFLFTIINIILTTAIVIPKNFYCYFGPHGKTFRHQ